MGEQHRGDPVERLGLDAGEPCQLGHREAGHRHAPACGRPCFGTAVEPSDEPLGVGRRLGVVPQLRRTDHLAALVEDDHAVLLAADRDRRRAVPLTRAGLLARGLERCLPVDGVLLAARWGGRRVRGPPRRHELAGVGVMDVHLAGRRGRVDADDERHGMDLTLSLAPPVRNSVQCRSPKDLDNLDTMNDRMLFERYRSAPVDTQRLVDRVLQEHEDDRAWADQIGPVFRQRRVAELLGKSRQAVSADRRLLRLQMRSGEIGYPVWQFDGRRPLPGIAAVLDTLGPVVATTWTVASWLTSRQPALDDGRPLDLLRHGDVDRVVAEAARLAGTWTR